MKLKFLVTILLVVLIHLGQALSLIPADNHARIYSSGNGRFCLKFIPAKIIGGETKFTPTSLCRVGDDGELIKMKEFANLSDSPLESFLISNDGSFFLSIKSTLPGDGKGRIGIKYDCAVEIFYADGARREIPPVVFEMTPDNENFRVCLRHWYKFDSPPYLTDEGILHLETVIGQKWTYDVAKNIAKKVELIKK